MAWGIAALTAALLAACGDGGAPDLVRKDEPGYTGLARCALCHTNLYAEWKRSHHSRAMGVPADSIVVGDFSGVEHTYGGVTSRMYREGDTYYMETLGPGGSVEPFRVDYTVGIRQHQAYLTTFPDGRLQVLPLYHDGETGRWVDAQEGGVLEQDAPPKPGDFYFWANRGRSWNYHCYDCHASRVLKNYDPATDTYETTVGSLTIDCESCHGPGKLHDDTRETPGAALNMVDLEKLSVDEQIEVCAQCHAAKEVIATGYAAGESFYDHYTLYLPDDETFHPDGQPRVYLYPVAGHLMSACYTDADLVCTTCHDPHGSGHEVDLVADKRTPALCASCHEEIAANPTAHSRHGFGSEGNTCVGCHMPYHHVTGEKMTDHRIASPSPRNTRLFGIPNSCNAEGCHADQTAEWAAGHVDEWFPGFQDREAERVRPYALGKAGDPAGIASLAGRLSDPGTPDVWRAVAATLLGRLEASQAVDGLIAALSDPHPMVRLRSAIALGRIGDFRAIPHLAAALADSARPVRMYSAFALSDIDFQPPRGETREAFDLALAEYERMIDDVHRDDPGLLDGLGELRERSGHYDAARTLFERVERLDPTHPETQADLDRIDALAAEFARGEPALRRAVEAAPEDFAARGRLGRFYVSHRRIEPAGLQLRGASARLRSPAVFLGDARVAADEGNVDGAIASVLQALDAQARHRGAARDLVRLVLSSGVEAGEAGSVADDSGWGWWTTGYERVRDGRLADARASFEMSLRRETALMHADSADVRDLVGVTRPGARMLDRWAGSAFEQGTAAFRAGRMGDAERHFRDCITLAPNDSRGYFLLALVLDETGRPAAALAAAEEGSLLEPAFAEGHGVLGAIEDRAGRRKRALVHYETAHAFDPAAPGIALGLGEIYMMNGQPDSARAVLRRLLEHDPENGPAREMLGRIGG